MHQQRAPGEGILTFSHLLLSTATVINSDLARALEVVARLYGTCMHTHARALEVVTRLYGTCMHTHARDLDIYQGSDAHNPIRDRTLIFKTSTLI